jgi:hypothetical protein
MARLTPPYTSLKTLNITYQAAQETLLGTPETLPTTEPATPQISYTVAAGDLPTFNLLPYQKKHIAILIGAGKAVTAATISYRMKKNGGSVESGSSSVPANYFYTRACFFYDVAVGDVLELALWSNQTDSNWDYTAFHIQASRLILLNKPRMLAPCNFAAVSGFPILTLGNPATSSLGMKVYHIDKQFATDLSIATVFDFMYPKNTYGLFRLNNGDYNSANSSICLTSATYRPNYYRNYCPTQMIMRGLNLG